MENTARIADAVADGVDFLTSSQLPAGDFEVLISSNPDMAGGCTPDPSVFPTALIVQALAAIPQAQAIRERAGAYLASEMDCNGLWRHWPRAHPHHHELPPDLDDTACASGAMESLGRSMAFNREVLLGNRDRRGLFHTWVTPRLRWPENLRQARIAWAQLRHPVVLALFFAKTSAKPYDVDAVVNANVCAYLGPGTHATTVIANAKAILRQEGEAVCDKWYENPFAVWCFFARGLADMDTELGELIVTRLGLAKPTTALDLALGLCALRFCSAPPRREWMAALVEAQQPSGAWPRAAIYHGGRRRRSDGGFDPPHPDTPRWGSEALTTAFAIQALAPWMALSRAKVSLSSC